jgi:hypothetical protein
MTRLSFRLMLAALCLTVVTAGPARSDSWFSGWGRKKATEDENSADAGFTSDGTAVAVGDEVDDAADSGEYTITLRRAILEKLQERRAARQANRQQRRMARRDAQYGYGYGYGGYVPPCHPQLNSSLYPCPRPDIPSEVGSTIITNQAFYPHEMLYGHQYRAIYPPFYYENKCGITCLPFIPRPCIAGTVVTVKYKTCLPCGFHPPVPNMCGLNYPYVAAGQASFHYTN